MRECKKCGASKPLAEFWRYSGRKVDGVRQRHPSWVCLTCHRAKDRVRERGYWERRKANRKYITTLTGYAKRKVRDKALECRKGGVPFDLDAEWYLERLPKGCELTGIAFDRTADNRRTLPSVDRVDQTRGYLKDNCRLVLNCVNAFRYDGTDEQMKAVAARLAPVPAVAQYDDQEWY